MEGRRRVGLRLLVRRRLVRAQMQGSLNQTVATLMHRSIKVICAAVRLGTSEFSLPPIVSGFRRFRGIRRFRIGDGLRLTCTNDSFQKSERFWLEVHYPSYKPLLSRGSFLEQGGVRANSNGGEAVIRIKFCYYPYYIPHAARFVSFRFVSFPPRKRERKREVGHFHSFPCVSSPRCTHGLCDGAF